jgi:hypothetical protein
VPFRNWTVFPYAFRLPWSEMLLWERLSTVDPPHRLINFMAEAQFIYIWVNFPLL